MKMCSLYVRKNIFINRSMCVRLPQSSKVTDGRNWRNHKWFNDPFTVWQQHAHGSGRIKLLPADHRGRQHAVVLPTSRVRRRPTSWEPPFRLGQCRSRWTQRTCFYFASQRNGATDTLGNGLGPLVANSVLHCVCCGLQWTNQQGLKANQNQWQKTKTGNE